MSAISSLSSQSSIYDLVSQLKAIDQVAVTKLEKKRDSLSQLNNIYTDLKTFLTSLRTAAENTSDAVTKPLKARTVASSDNTVATATASGNAALGSHEITVLQLAKRHTMVSNLLANDDTSLAAALGGADQSFTITLGEVSKTINVDIESTSTNREILDAMASAINAAFEDEDHPVTATSLGVTASSAKLILKSGGTGLENKLTLADESGSALLSVLGLDAVGTAATDTTGGYMHADDQLDAVMVVDGIQVTRGTNAPADVLRGVTLNLTALASEPVTLTVAPDVSSIRSTVDNFLTAYNEAVNYLTAKTQVDRSTGTRAALAGKSLYLSLLSDLRTIAGSYVSGTGSDAISLLSQVGITQASNGTLSVEDEGKLSDALRLNQEAFNNLFSASNGICTQLSDLLKPFNKTGGYLDMAQDAGKARIASLKNVIERTQARVDAKSARVTAQYSKLQEIATLYNGQSSAISSLLG